MLDIYNHADCFSSFQSNLAQLVKTYYFGLSCKLFGRGKLLTIVLDLVEAVIEFGKIAVVESGDQLLLAQVVGGFKNRNGGWTDLKLCYLGEEEGEEFVPFAGSYVIFQWGNGEPFSLSNFQHDILEIWNIRGLIGWDQEKSKKRIIVEFENDPGKDGWNKPMCSYENGFIGVISSPKMTNQIKKWECFQPSNNVERQQLRQDLDDVESRLFLHLGIRHNPFSKEERQNNPEVLSGQAFFYAWEVKYREGFVKGILDFQEKPWGGGEYIYQFGSLPTLEIREGEVICVEENKNPNYINDNSNSNLKFPPKKEQMTNQEYLMLKEKLNEK